MTTVDGIILTIAIPQNLMHFYCSLNSGKATLSDIQKVHPTAQYNSEGTIVFDLKKENPQMLRDIIQAVKTSSSITMTNKCKKHQKNRSFLEALEVRNQIHKYDSHLTVSDIVKMISYDNYDTSMIAEDKEFSGKELHAFHNIDVYGISFNAESRIYVKFWVPGEAETGDIKVVSMHRSKELKFTYKDSVVKQQKKVQAKKTP